MKFVVCFPEYIGIDKDTFSMISHRKANDCGDRNGCRIAVNILSAFESRSRCFTAFIIRDLVSPLFSILIMAKKSATSMTSPNRSRGSLNHAVLL